MDPLLIMKDLVDRKKSTDVEIKESKKVYLLQYLYFVFTCIILVAF